MIMECDITINKDGYCSIHYNEYISAQKNESIADSLSDDCLYQDASWYRARARECGKGYRWQHAGEAYGDIGFCQRDLRPSAYQRLRKLIVDASYSKALQKVIRNQPAHASFKFIDINRK